MQTVIHKTITYEYEQLVKVIDHHPLRPGLTEADVIDAGVARCGATTPATILDDFKTPLEGRKNEAETDTTAGSYRFENTHG